MLGCNRVLGFTLLELRILILAQKPCSSCRSSSSDQEKHTHFSICRSLSLSAVRNSIASPPPASPSFLKKKPHFILAKMQLYGIHFAVCVCSSVSRLDSLSRSRLNDLDLYANGTTRKVFMILFLWFLVVSTDIPKS